MTLSDNRIKRLVEETLDRVGRDGRLNKLTAPCPGPTNKHGFRDRRFRAPHWFDGVHDWSEDVSIAERNGWGGRGNPCNFWCKKCGWAVDMHRFGKPYRDEVGKMRRRCLNKGEDRTHLQHSRRVGRCRTTMTPGGLVRHYMPPTDEVLDDGQRWVARGGEREGWMATLRRGSGR